MDEKERLELSSDVERHLDNARTTSLLVNAEVCNPDGIEVCVGSFLGHLSLHMQAQTASTERLLYIRYVSGVWVDISCFITGWFHFEKECREAPARVRMQGGGEPRAMRMVGEMGGRA